MRTRTLFIALLCVGLPGLVAPAASADPVTPNGNAPAMSRASAPTAKLTAPDEVTEGDRYTIRVKVKSESRFSRATLEQRVPDIYGDPSWQSIKKRSVNGRQLLAFQAVGGLTDRETFRVVLQPKSGRPIESKPISVDVWHWYPLATFDSYYATEGVADYEGNQFAMNGRSYISSWFTYGTPKNWESRYTLGRNCRTMSGTFGVTDKSTDGSSGAVQILAEGVYPVYTSPPLTPGVVDTQTVELGTPYRISIIGTNTSPDKILAYPAAGDLQFLCTGLG